MGGMAGKARATSFKFFCLHKCITHECNLVEIAKTFVMVNDE